MSTTLAYPHVLSDPKHFDGWAYIEGSRVRVVDIAAWYRAGLSADQIAEQFPTVTTAAVFAALAYYHDHLAEIERQLEVMDRDWAKASTGTKVPAKLARTRKRKKPT